DSDADEKVLGQHGTLLITRTGTEITDQTTESVEMTEWQKEFNRRQLNRKELFRAPDAILFRFLQELMTRVKFLPDANRISIYRNLLDHQLLECLSSCIEHEQISPANEYSHVWLVVVETLYHLVSTPINLAEDIRAYIVKQIAANKPNLLQQLCRGISVKAQTDSALLDQMQNVLRLIMGMFFPLMLIERVHGISLSQAKLVDYFFSECLPTLLEPLKSHNPYQSHRRYSASAQHTAIAHSQSDNDIVMANIDLNDGQCASTVEWSQNEQHLPSHHDNDKDNENELQSGELESEEDFQALECLRLQQKFIVQVLIQCITHYREEMKRVEERYHVMRIVYGLVDLPILDFEICQRYPMIRLQFVSFLKKIKNKKVVLVMDSIRFLRDCLSKDLKDNFWNKRFIEEELFDNIFRIFEQNGLQTNNLLNCTVLSLFEKINELNLTSVIQYLGQLRIEDHGCSPCPLTDNTVHSNESMPLSVNTNTNTNTNTGANEQALPLNRQKENEGGVQKKSHLSYVETEIVSQDTVVSSQPSSESKESHTTSSNEGTCESSSHHNSNTNTNTNTNTNSNSNSNSNGVKIKSVLAKYSQEITYVSVFKRLYEKYIKILDGKSISVTTDETMVLSPSIHETSPSLLTNAWRVEDDEDRYFGIDEEDDNANKSNHTKRNNATGEPLSSFEELDKVNTSEAAIATAKDQDQPPDSVTNDNDDDNNNAQAHMENERTNKLSDDDNDSCSTSSLSSTIEIVKDLSVRMTLDFIHKTNEDKVPCSVPSIKSAVDSIHPSSNDSHLPLEEASQNRIRQQLIQRQPTIKKGIFLIKKKLKQHFLKKKNNSNNCIYIISQHKDAKSNSAFRFNTFGSLKTEQDLLSSKENLSSKEEKEEEEEEGGGGPFKISFGGLATNTSTHDNKKLKRSYAGMKTTDSESDDNNASLSPSLRSLHHDETKRRTLSNDKLEFEFGTILTSQDGIAFEEKSLLTSQESQMPSKKRRLPSTAQTIDSKDNKNSIFSSVQTDRSTF
ncbi:hypothetical protein RFI_11220, partial [Reticulomyxa filosa]